MPKPFNPSKFKSLSQIALVCYWGIMFLGTHLPPSTPFLPNEAHNLDKLYHFSAYAILAVLLATTWQLSAGTLNGRHLSWAWLAVITWGALDEITQIPFNRDCSIWDWTADATGAVFGLLAFAWLRKTLTARLAQRE